MTPEVFKQELNQLFPGQNLNIAGTEVANEAKIKINRELTRLELGHLFSLGMKSIKRSGEGLSITFDLNKAHLNTAYQTF